MTFTGTADLDGKNRGHEIAQSINAYTTAKILVNDRNLSGQATFQSNLLKSLIYTEDVYTNTILRGEIRKMSTTFNHVEYTVLDKSRKLLSQEADYNFNKYVSFFRLPAYTASNGAYTIKDGSLSFSGKGVEDGDLMHFGRSTKNKIFLPPNNIQASTGDVYKYKNGTSDEFKEEDGEADTIDRSTSGDVNALYSRREGSFNYQWYATGANFENTVLRLDFYFAIRDGISINKISSIDVELQTRELSKFGATDNTDDDPWIGLWDGSKYEVAYLRGSDTGGRWVGEDDSESGYRVTPWTIKKVNEEDISDMSDNPEKYLSSGIETDGEMTLYRIRIGIGMGQDALNRKQLNLRTVNINLSLDSDQVPEIGVCTISDTGSGTLTLGDGLGADSRQALLDGIAAGDIYIITDTLDDQIDAIASDWGITINRDITDSDKLGLVGNHTTSTRIEVIQEICNVSNSVWWYDPSGDQYYIVSADKLDGSDPTYQTGITITKDDIVDYLQPGAWSYEIDANNIRDSIVVKGDNVFGTATITTSPEFSHTLGDEQQIINKSEITSFYHLRKFADSIKHQYEKARRVATFTLDFDKPNQDYSALEIGKTIKFLVPDASDTTTADHGTNDELLVTNLQWSRKPGSQNRRRVTVTAERRYS